MGFAGLSSSFCLRADTDFNIAALVIIIIVINNHFYCAHYKKNTRTLQLSTATQVKP